MPGVHFNLLILQYYFRQPCVNTLIDIDRYVDWNVARGICTLSFYNHMRL